MDLSLEIFLKIIYALGIGVLIGLERSLLPYSPSNGREGEKSEDDPKKQLLSSMASDYLLGVRTYSILSIGGFSAALIGASYPSVAPVIVAGLIILIIAMYMHSRDVDPGITTEIAAVVCCGLGMLCYINPHAAGVLALVMAVLLALKRSMARALKRLKRIELTDTLKFLAIILIILPLLPNRTLDPFEVFNPFKVTFLVVLISGISFVGYFLTKFLGAERGLGLTGLFGGLTSSTAVTAAMASQAKQSPGLRNPCALATIIANATMFGRVLVVVALLDWALMLKLVWSIGTMTVAAIISVIFLWLRSKNAQSEGGSEASKEIQLKNPFSLGPAIKFSLFFVVILFVAKVAKIYLGDQGLYLASLVSGLADVDAITLSIAEQTRDAHLAHNVGAIGITIAVVANSIVKSGIAIYSGGWRFGWLVSLILLAATGAGLGVLLVL